MWRLIRRRDLNQALKAIQAAENRCQTALTVLRKSEGGPTRRGPSEDVWVKRADSIVLQTEHRRPPLHRHGDHGPGNKRPTGEAMRGRRRARSRTPHTRCHRMEIKHVES